jgi:hypothetical protein
VEGGEKRNITGKGRRDFSEDANKGQVRETVRRKLPMLLQKVHKRFSGLDHVEVTFPDHVTGIDFDLSDDAVRVSGSGGVLG